MVHNHDVDHDGKRNPWNVERSRARAIGIDTVRPLAGAVGGDAAEGALVIRDLSEVAGAIESSGVDPNHLLDGAGDIVWDTAWRGWGRTCTADADSIDTLKGLVAAG